MAINNFKSDDSFLEKLAVGAAGVNATMRSLKELGYQPIELERGSSGYKIWKKIKIKRVRVPDILCLKSGQRFESRGKTKLELSMSHSLRDPNRAWDAGMRPDDLVSFVMFEKADDTPVNWRMASPVHYVRVDDMRDAFKRNIIQITKPKGVEEGSEIRVIWPSKTAAKESTVKEITDRLIKLEFVDKSGQQRCILTRKKFSLIPQCNVGDLVAKNQIIASVVPIHSNPVCQAEVDEFFFRERLQSAALSERYAAAKALRFRGFSSSGKKLKERMHDQDEDIYVQLEAAAALAAQGDSAGWDFLTKMIDSTYLALQLETVIVVSEIPSKQSEEILIRILMDGKRDSEIRAGAAWGLGEFTSQSVADALINTFDVTNPEIKIEAARALLRIAPPNIQYLANSLKISSSTKRDGIAWTLARSGKFNIADLTNDDDDNLRQWLSYIAGFGKSYFTEKQITALCESDPEVYFAASVLWQVISSWIYNLREY